MVLVFDPRGAGISGDMVLAALVDMGADGESICDRIRECAGLLPGSSIREMSFREESRGGIRCTRLVLETDDRGSMPASEMADAVRGAVSKMGLSEAAAGFADRSVRSLISAEAHIHGVSPDSVHLHEAASLDTFVDIAGTAAALDQLGVAGESGYHAGKRGRRVRHLLPWNVPESGPGRPGDTAESRHTRGGRARRDGDGHAHGRLYPGRPAAAPRPFYPQISVSAAGYGSGSKEISGAANVLRIIRGEGELHAYDRISVLETNVDDVSGETLGRTVSTAMEMGAADAAVYPRDRKEGKAVQPHHDTLPPGDDQRDDRHGDTPTCTLGVRVTTADRYTLPRENHTATIRIGGTGHAIRYKTHAHHDIRGFKIEADDIAKVSARTGLPPHQIERLARRQIEDDG